jgi:beta-phosphoglucomutase
MGLSAIGGQRFCQKPWLQASIREGQVTKNGAAIWDVDGTLVDTAELHFKAWVELAAAIGKPFTRADFAATFGRRNPEIILALFDRRATDEAVADLGEHKEEIYRAAARREGVTLLPGVRELLDGIAALGWSQAVGSSAPRANLEMILSMTGTAANFAAVVSAEDTTRGKPDPQVFQIAAMKLCVPPKQCVVFEDAVAGVEAAKAAGMKCIAVRFVGHHPADKLKAAGADRVVECLTEIDAADVQELVE